MRRMTTDGEAVYSYGDRRIFRPEIQVLLSTTVSNFSCIVDIQFGRSLYLSATDNLGSSQSGEISILVCLPRFALWRARRPKWAMCGRKNSSDLLFLAFTILVVPFVIGRSELAWFDRSLDQ